VTFLCARCRRPILVPVIVNGHGFGKRCAALVGDLLVQPAEPKRKRRARAKKDAHQMGLLEVLP